MNGNPRLVVGSTTTSYALYQSNTLISANTWYHGAVTFDSVNGHKMYINGVLDNTSANVTLSLASGIQIGAFSNGNLFNGNIGSPMIYNRELSANEIQQNFNALKGRYGL